MNINTFIEVQAFGDFDQIYTECIMVHSDKMNKDEILKEFYHIMGISSNVGLDYRIIRGLIEDFVSFLEMKGFKKLETEIIYFCD